MLVLFYEWIRVISDDVNSRDLVALMVWQETVTCSGGAIGQDGCRNLSHLDFMLSPFTNGCEEVWFLLCQECLSSSNAFITLQADVVTS